MDGSRDGRREGVTRGERTCLSMSQEGKEGQKESVREKEERRGEIERERE